MSLSTFPFDRHTRLAVLDDVAVLSSPTVAELTDATDVSQDITPSGLVIQRSTGEIDRTKWGDTQTSSAPTRWTTAVSLTAYRRRPPLPGVLRPLITFGAPVVLAVRYGWRWDVDWEVGQEVEVIRGRWAKPATAGSARNQSVTFTVGIVVAEDDDAAVVAP